MDTQQNQYKIRLRKDIETHYRRAEELRIEAQRHEDLAKRYQVVLDELEEVE